MFRIFRGELREAVGSPTGAAPAAAAPPAPPPAAAPAVLSTAAEATAQGDQNAWAQIAREAEAMGKQAQVEAPAPAGLPATATAPATAPAAPHAGQAPVEPNKPAESTTETKPPEEAPQFKEFPKIEDFRPKSPNEAYLQRQALREQRQQEQTLKAQYEAQIAALQQQAQEASSALTRYRSLRAEGKIDEALKAIGDDGLEALNKARLQAVGALPKEDPRVTELQKELTALKQAEQQRQEAIARQHAQWQAQQEHAAYVGQVRDAMVAAKEYRGIPELAQVNGVPEFVWQSVQQNPNQPMEWHFAVANQQFRGIFDSLSAVFGAQQPVAQPTVTNTDPAPVTSVGTPAQPGAAVVRPGGQAPPVALPQAAAADARGSTTFTGNDDADWAALKHVFNQQVPG